jgi:LuxR family maltose regulon positive regulatory protein
VELANQRIGKQTPVIGKTLLNLGEMLREQGNLEAAQKYLLEAAGMMESFSEIGLPLAFLAIARVYLNKKEWPAAQSYIDRARQRALASKSTLMDDRLVDVMQARYWIARGELDPVVQWADRRGFLNRTPAEVFGEADRNAAINELLQAEYLAAIRLILAQRQPEQALEMINFLQFLAEKRGYQRRIIELLILKAIALHQTGTLDQALSALGEALSLAEPEGYQRTFVDEGEPMAKLLYQAVTSEVSPVYAGRLLGVLTEESQSVRSPGNSPEEGLIEALSERELEVLQWIAAGLSNSEIAGRLYISLSTVKGHTAKIFGKLGVKNRTQAVAQARSLGLFTTG